MKKYSLVLEAFSDVGDDHPAPKLRLVKDNIQHDDILELVGLSAPKEINPSSTEIKGTGKSPEHLQATADVELFRAKMISATELRNRYINTYRNWSGMKTRCNGDLSTFLHPSFEKFADFLEIMGPRPEPTWSIDRIDPTGPYSPDNVRWASKTTQARNRTNTVYLTYQGTKRPLVEWAELKDENPDTFRGRLRDGWSDAEIIEGHRVSPHQRGNHRLKYSRDPFDYTPWPQNFREHLEHLYQRHKWGEEYRLTFAKRYSEERMAAITNEADACSWPDYYIPSPAEIAESERLTAQYNGWESIRSHTILLLSGEYGSQLYGRHIPESIEEKLRAYA